MTPITETSGAYHAPEPTTARTKMAAAGLVLTLAGILVGVGVLYGQVQDHEDAIGTQYRHLDLLRTEKLPEIARRLERIDTKQETIREDIGAIKHLLQQRSNSRR